MVQLASLIPGLHIDDNAPRMNINSYLLIIQSALNSLGLSQGWEYLADDYLTSSLLINPKVTV